MLAGANSDAQTSGAAPWQKWFCLAVLALAVFQFSENTADPDLWAHVLFGRHFLETGTVMKADPYSWTAPQYPWINHEVIAEILLGGAHRLLGGPGLLLLKILCGLGTFLIAIVTANRFLPRSARPVAWAFGALAVVEISFGFAARPQIFTALALALFYWLVQKIQEGRLLWALALPPLFTLWINTHGGALAGIVLLFVIAVSTTLQSVLKKSGPTRLAPLLTDAAPPRVQLTLWLATLASAGALLVNPWGAELIRWLIGSVLWLRPEIDEWNPARLGWDHGVFFITAAISAAAFLFTRKPRSLWGLAVTGALGVMAFRSVRHTPLFCVTALAFVPPYLAEILERLKTQSPRWQELARNPSLPRTLSLLCGILAAAIGVATVTLHKEHPFTMEVPRAQYPVAAVDFIRSQNLRGNLVVFFDWGEMCMWELPESRVSVDGRLDTSYPRSVINAHWKFYNAAPFDTNALDLAKADYALLPANLSGSLALKKDHGWQPVYFDNLAVVLVKDAKQFPQLSALSLPVQGSATATQGRAPFSSAPRSPR